MAKPRVLTITNGAFQENCFIVADDAARAAALVDPGEEADVFLRRLESESLVLGAVWLTHAHIDHVLGIARIVEATGAPVYLHPDDRSMYDGVGMQGAWFGLRVDPLPQPTHELTHGGRVAVGDFEFEVRHVPGHSPGSVAFVGHGLAIVGDALFAGSVGRVDLPGGDGRTLLHSIRTQLLTLPDDTVVYAGHGPETTIGRERVSNPFLTGAVSLE